MTFRKINLWLFSVSVLNNGLLAEVLIILDCFLLAYIAQVIT